MYIITRAWSPSSSTAPPSPPSARESGCIYYDIIRINLIQYNMIEYNIQNISATYIFVKSMCS